MNEWNPEANAIFAEVATTTDAKAREQLLDKKCGTNEPLRRAVESLLSAHDQDPMFLDEGLVNADMAPTARRVDEAIGCQIGPFRLLQKIGEGGFGVVYMAEQKKPIRRKVALKVIKAGMDTREVIARFEAERQALAMMEHPNIAKVLDGGTTASGRPYFVMELVRGVAITEFCDENKTTTHERLELFASVCQAVQHAHQKGVIHRDLKPSNVMVTLSNGQPLVKVIDFGVAKAINQELTEKTLFTLYGQMVGTPQYMSPEQAAISATDLDTRSDIYSLGVLLYELLTGGTPLDAARLRKSAFAEVQRMIREEEPQTPSLRLQSIGDRLSTIANNRKTDPARLPREVAGDLDWIVMKCLEKDRRRRYSTANDLAADVSRHLDGLAVEACPPTFRYRMSKLVRRHRIPFAFGTAVLSLLVISSIVAWYLFAVSNSARNKEKLARKDAETAKQDADDQRTRAEKSLDELQNRTRQLEVTSDRLSSQLYSANVARAANAYRDNDHLTARTFLDRCIVPGDRDLRSWEWHYLSSAITSDCTISVDGPAIHHMTSSPIEGRIAVIDKDGEVSRLVIYDLDREQQTSRPVWVRDLDMAVPFKPVFSSDGSMVAVASYGNLAPEYGRGSIQVIDVNTQELLWEQRMADDQVEVVGGMVFRPDSSELIYSRYVFLPERSGHVFCRDIRQKKERWRADLAAFAFPSVSADHKNLYITAVDQPTRDLGTKFECRSIATGEKLWEVERPSFSYVVPEPTGQRLLIGSERHFESRDADDPGMTIQSFEDAGFMNATFNKRGDRVLLVNTDNSLSIRQLPDYKEIQRWQAFSDEITSWNGDAHWTWDGNSILHTSGANNQIEFRRAVPPEQLAFTHEQRQPANSYCYSPNGELTYGVGPNESLTVWDSSTGKEMRRIKVGTFRDRVTVSADGSLIAVGGDDGLKILNANTFALIGQYEGHGVWNIAISPDCKTVVFGGLSRTYAAWDIESGEKLREHQAMSNNGGVIFLDNDHALTICDGSRRLIYWNVKTGAITKHGDGKMIRCTSLAFSQRQQLIAAGVDDRIEFWDFRDKAAPTHTKLPGHRVQVKKLGVASH